MKKTDIEGAMRDLESTVRALKKSVTKVGEVAALREHVASLGTTVRRLMDEKRLLGERIETLELERELREAEIADLSRRLEIRREEV